MKRFAQLFCDIGQTNRTNEKVEALEKYFSTTPPEDALWALRFLTGRLLPRAVNTRKMREWTGEMTGYPIWLIDECFDSVGDFGETLALLLRGKQPGIGLSLHRLVEERLLPLQQLPEQGRRELLMRTWRELNETECFVWNKLITGSFRIGVSRILVVRAVANVAGISPALMAHRLMGKWNPTTEDYLKLIDPAESAHEPGKPYPFYLASPLQESPETLGHVSDWQVEWKWDGIRAQLIRRNHDSLIWSRGDEMVTESFPEIINASEVLPNGTVLDGEILAWEGNAPLPFARLQRRLGRKQVSQKTRKEHPVAFLAYDLLEFEGKDVRDWPLLKRRQRLEIIIREAQARQQPSVPSPPLFLFDMDALSNKPQRKKPPFTPTLQVSPLVDAVSWEQFSQLQKEARQRGVEGLMLKRKSSVYAVGRPRGEWWKWKIDPYVIDAVLIMAQTGSGKRASLFTDYTFGLWQDGALVPVAKAYSGLTDEEIEQVDHFVRTNTVDQFGPVRVVKPELVFELAFEGIQESTRHKAGVAVRFPRMNRWRKDKKPADADTVEGLKNLSNQPGDH
jgi:DNA ligase-1